MNKLKPAASHLADLDAARIAREAALIAEARADVAAGRVIDAAEVDGWIDSIGTDAELPPPHLGR